MDSLSELSEVLQDLLTNAADEVASQCGFIQRRRKITGSGFAQAFVFASLSDEQLTRSRLHTYAAAVGLEVSRQGLDKRFDARGAEFLRRLLAVAASKAVATPVTIPLFERFTCVEVFDSTVVALLDELADTYRGGRSGRSRKSVAKASVKLTVGVDLRAGVLRGPELTAGRTGDLSVPLAEESPPQGGLQIADLNYFSLTKFALWGQAGAYWLSRFKSGTKVYDDRGQPIDLLARLKAAGPADVDLDIRLGSRERLACRLIARRVPPEVAALRRRRLSEKGADRGNRPSALSLALCDWTVLVTSVPRGLLSVEEAIALARMRWQIELLFKLWKSHGGIDVHRSTDPPGVLCELYGKLLAQVIRHWVTVVGAWSQRKRSLTKAAEIVRAFAMSLAAAMRSPLRLRAVLRTIGQLMDIAARMEKRRAAPNAHDIIFCIDPGP